MNYRIHIAPRALSDLTDIFDFIVRDSPQNARTTLSRLLDAIDDLEFMPARFKIVGKSRKYQTPVHARVMQPFRIYYRIDEQAGWVFILEVRHGARKQPQKFG